MSNIICVYQDCPMCGDRGKKLKDYVESNQIELRKVSFASAEGQELIARGVYEHKIRKMPFFTDGIKFSESLSDFVPAPVEKPKKTKTVKKTTKRTRKTKKQEVEHESAN